jgi:hypothetical protein
MVARRRPWAHGFGEWRRATPIRDDEFQKFTVMHIRITVELECCVTQPRAQSIQLSAISIGGRFRAEMSVIFGISVLSIEPKVFVKNFIAEYSLTAPGRELSA